MIAKLFITDIIVLVTAFMIGGFATNHFDDVRYPYAVPLFIWLIVACIVAVPCLLIALVWS